MKGQGVAASPAPAAGRQDEPGASGVVAAELADPGEDRVTSVVANGGEGQGLSGDDSHVMAAPGHPEASAQDTGMSPQRKQSPPPESTAEDQPSQEPAAEHQPQEPAAEYQPTQGPPSAAPSQAAESDKPDNVVGPDQDEAPARDELTGHDQSAAAPETPAEQLPPEGSTQPARDSAQDLAQPEDAALRPSLRHTPEWTPGCWKPRC